LQFSLNVTLL